MEYLYVPTTTLNFNNILSTGSISPAAVYAARQFGYKQFEVVEPNPFRNVLLLYDRYPEFILEDADRDNYPMVLRIRKDRLAGKLMKQPGGRDDINVYAYAETIYFDPTSADLMFPSEEVISITLTKAEPSLTTKLVELFRPFMRVPGQGELDSFTWSGALLEDVKDGDKSTAIRCCETDNRINRLKGFASGYILGAYKSIDPKLANVRTQVRMIRNEASARLNDPYQEWTDSRREKVESSCSTLERFFAEVEIGKKRFDHKLGDSIQIKEQKVGTINDRHETDPRSTQSLVQLVNDYCLASQFYGKLDEQRLDIAMEGAQFIREIIGDQWDGSDYQKYINTWLNNIKNGSEFDFDASSSLALQSFAAFILKGDDLQKLEAFLTVHGIGDFRIAFALWGAMCGFSKLPKTLYNLPIQQGETAYLEWMHAYVHSAVHGIPLNDLHRQKTPPVDPDSFAVLDKLVRDIPQAKKWRGGLENMLSDCGGLNNRFIEKLKDTKVKDLGGNLRKGARRADVEKFFEDTLKHMGDMPLFKQQQQQHRHSDVDSQRMPELFVNDRTCADELLRIEKLSDEKKQDLAESLRKFQARYKPDGFYSSKPQQYQRDNSNAIDHFIRCLYSLKTKDLNVSLTKSERTTVKNWLMTRYSVEGTR